MIGILGSIFWIIGFVTMVFAVISEKGEAKLLWFIIAIIFLSGTSYSSGLGNADDPDQGYLYHIESNPIEKDGKAYVVMSNVDTIGFYSRASSSVDLTLKRGDWATYENGIIKKVNQT